MTPAQPPHLPAAFEPGERIGAGGSGEVWAAVHRRSGTLVAVKVLTHALALTPEGQAAFRREAEAVAALDHPHVVRLFDFGVNDQGAPYLVMERGSGTLRGTIGRMDWTALRGALEAVMGALAHAHARELVHLDLKPDNVLVGCGAVADERGLVHGLRLADFGIAQLLGRDAGRLAGTPAYVAPEQALGAWRDFGPWTDLYALGALAWELCTGQPPLARKTPKATLRAQLRDPLPPFTPTIPVPKGLRIWLGSLLAKRPEARPRCAAAALAGLAALGAPEAGEVSHAVPISSESSAAATTFCVFDSIEMQPEDTPFDDPPPAPAPAGPVTLPADWREDRPTLTPLPLMDAGLGLFGLRPPPIIGRRGERDTLWALLRDSLDQRAARGALLQGAVGMGTSRLAEWLACLAHASGCATVLRVRADTGGLRGALTRWSGCAGLRAPRITQRLADRAPGCPLEDLARLAAWLADDDDSPAPMLPLLRLVEVMGATRGVLVLLDDAERCPAELESALRLLRAQGEATPLVVLVTASEQPLDALARLDNVTRLQLDPLEPHEMRQLLSEVLRVDAALAERLVAEGGGNPGRVVAAVAGWVRRGLLHPGPSGFHLETDGLEDLTDDLDALRTDRRGEVDPDAADPDDVASRARQLLRSGQPEAAFTLVEGELDRRSEAGQWQSLHRLLQVGQQALEGAGDDDPRRLRLGRWRLVGLMNQGYYEEAVRLGEALLARARVGGASRLLGALLSGTGNAMRFTGRHAEAVRLLTEARDLGRVLGATRVQLLSQERLAYALGDAGRFDEGAALMRELVALGERHGDPIARSGASAYLSEVARRRGALEEAWAHGLAALEAVTDSRYGSRRAECERRLSNIAGARGDLDEAERRIERALMLARTYGLVSEEASCLNSAHHHLLQRGERGRALEVLRDALRIRTGLGGDALIIRYNLVQALVERGDFIPALAELERCAALLPEVGAPVETLAQHTMMAVVQAGLGQRERCAVALEQVEALAGQGYAMQALLLNFEMLARIAGDHGWGAVEARAEALAAAQRAALSI
ncbi:MAG: protein kinase [Alphaproteobacteria bacterium]|nr:protein kinase [Alphaproteobacteria bacterium]